MHLLEAHKIFTCVRCCIYVSNVARKVRRTTNLQKICSKISDTNISGQHALSSFSWRQILGSKRNVPYLCYALKDVHIVHFLSKQYIRCDTYCWWDRDNINGIVEVRWFACFWMFPQQHSGVYLSSERELTRGKRACGPLLLPTSYSKTWLHQTCLLLLYIHGTHWEQIFPLFVSICLCLLVNFSAYISMTVMELMSTRPSVLYQKIVISCGRANASKLR